MSFSFSLRDQPPWTCQELEFNAATTEMVMIIPNVTEKEMVRLLCGHYGPFKADIPAEVPLWIAVAMKRGGRCRIVPPAWMSVDALQEVLDQERKNPGVFSEVPYNYAQISTLLLSIAAEDVPDHQQVKNLLDDIERARAFKLSSTIKVQLEQAANQNVEKRYIMTNADALAVAYLKSGLFKALDHIVEMAEAQDELNRQAEEASAAGLMGSGYGSSSMRRSRLYTAGSGAGSASAGGYSSAEPVKPTTGVKLRAGRLRANLASRLAEASPDGEGPSSSSAAAAGAGDDSGGYDGNADDANTNNSNAREGADSGEGDGGLDISNEPNGNDNNGDGGGGGNDDDGDGGGGAGAGAGGSRLRRSRGKDGP